MKLQESDLRITNKIDEFNFNIQNIMTQFSSNLINNLHNQLSSKIPQNIENYLTILRDNLLTSIMELFKQKSNNDNY